MAKITFFKRLGNPRGNPCVGCGLHVPVGHHTCFAPKVAWWPHTPHCNHPNTKWGGWGGGHHATTHRATLGVGLGATNALGTFLVVKWHEKHEFCTPKVPKCNGHPEIAISNFNPISVQSRESRRNLGMAIAFWDLGGAKFVFFMPFLH